MEAGLLSDVLAEQAAGAVHACILAASGAALQQQAPGLLPTQRPAQSGGGGGGMDEGSQPGLEEEMDGVVEPGGGVLCPVCRAAWLVQPYPGFVACPRERWQLDVRAEGLTLEHVRALLAHAYEVRDLAGTSCGKSKRVPRRRMAFTFLRGAGAPVPGAPSAAGRAAELPRPPGVWRRGAGARAAGDQPRGALPHLWDAARRAVTDVWDWWSGDGPLILSD